MSMIEMFFAQTVTIMPFVREGAGEPIYGETETRPCRLERGGVLTNTKAMNQNGVINTVPSGARMYCVGNPIPVGSIVKSGDRDYVVTACDVLNGFADDHLEVTLQ